mgnify:CR=1 FL=1
MSTPILHLLTDTNKSIYLKDPIEPEKGSMKAVLNTRYLFDAVIFSYLNGNKNYKLSFDIDDILDKISKSGYDSLTKEEKEFLFKAGK